MAARSRLPAIALACFGFAAAVLSFHIPTTRRLSSSSGGAGEAFAAVSGCRRSQHLRGGGPGQLAGSRRPGADSVAQRLSLLRLAAAGEGSWIEVRNSQDEQASGEGEVLPLFPLKVIEWPGNTVEVKVNEPAHIKLYQDLLMSGARRIIAPLARGPQGEGEEDQEDEAEGGATGQADPAEFRLHEVGAVLYLEDLQEVSEKTGGQFKYIAKHSVEGVARIHRVLNPSSFYKKNEQGLKTEYAKVEVDVLPDTEDLKSGFAGEGAGVRAAYLAAELVEVWEDLRLLSERAEEPRLQSQRFAQETVRKSPTWQLADLWQRLQLSTLVHRERARVTEEVKEWIEVQQQAGRLPRQLPPQVDVTKIGLPAPLVEDFVKAHTQSPLSLKDEFWVPLLDLLTTETAQARAKLLVDMAQMEIKVTRARVNLKELLG